jgi:hypothetical protein
MLTPAILHIGNNNTNFISVRLIYEQPKISDSPRGALFLWENYYYEMWL